MLLTRIDVMTSFKKVSIADAYSQKCIRTALPAIEPGIIALISRLAEQSLEKVK